MLRIFGAKSFSHWASQACIVVAMSLIVSCGGGATQDSPASLAGEEATNAPPTISVSSPSNGGNQSENETTNLSATALDPEDGNISDNIRWSSNIDGDLGTGASINVILSLGSHAITASITDSKDLSKTDSVSYSIVSNNLPPTISITSPASGGSQVQNSSTTLTATANDQEDGDLSASIQWTSSIGGSLGSGGSLSVTLAPGTHTITAEVSDSGSLIARSTISYQIIAENLPPSIAITAPTDGGSQPSGQTTLLQASANDNEDGNLGSDIEWSSNMDGSLGTGSSLTVGLSTAEHIIAASVTDSNNQTASTNITYTLVATFGSATLSWTAPTENTDGTPLTDLAGFTLYYGTDQNDLSQSITINVSSQTEQVVEGLSVEQTYYFAMSAFNETGAESQRSSTVSKSIGG